MDLAFAAAIFALYLLLSTLTLNRYGVTLDEPEHWYFGDHYLNFYLTCDRGALNFSSTQWSPNQTWPVGPTLAALSGKIFSERLRLVSQHDGRHLANLILFGLLLCSVYMFMVAHADRAAASLSCLALALQPRIWGDAHNNSEDIPHLVFFALAILAFLHATLTKQARWLLASAIVWGLALGSKINALTLPLVIVPMLGPLIWERAQQPVSIKRSLVAYPIIALTVVILVWPYFWEDPFNRVALFVSYIRRWGWGGPKGWQALPTLNVLITTPLPTLVFSAIGVVALIRTGRPLCRRASLTLLTWLCVPIVRSSLPGALNYDAIRRFMEFAPALAILAGIGGSHLIAWSTQYRLLHGVRWTWAVRMMVTAAFLSPATAIVRYFPYETAYYNILVGGLAGAQSLKIRSSIDYHYSSYREGVGWLNAHADRGSFVIAQPTHLIPYYPLRQDLVLTKHLWMDELPIRGQSVYLMTVTSEGYDYNTCLAEAFLQPEFEVRRDGGVLLRIYKLGVQSRLSVARNAFPPPKAFAVTLQERVVTFSWEPTHAGNTIGHILYVGRLPGQYDASSCFREARQHSEFLAFLPRGRFYLSLSVITRQREESERTPDMRVEYYD